MKVHLSMPRYSFAYPCREPSICGMNPEHGSYDIRTVSTFFQSPEKDQCSRCLHLYRQRGNSVEKARAAAKLMPSPSGRQVLEDRQKAGAPC